MGLYFYQCGADGVIAGSAGGIPQYVVAVDRAVHRGDWAQARDIFYEKVLPIFYQAVFPYTASKWKHVLMWKGIIRSARVRYPWLPIDEAKKRELRAAVEKVGFLV